VRSLTGQDFAQYVTQTVALGKFYAEGVVLQRKISPSYFDPEWINNKNIVQVLGPRDSVSGLVGPLDGLCRFYRGILDQLATAEDDLAATLTSANPGPDFFGRGISVKQQWALGSPRYLSDQGFRSVVPADAFGAQGAVLTLTSRGPRYAAVCVAGALPTCNSSFAVTIDGLSPSPDPRYRLIVEALVRDLERVNR
jgi:hypothetical protein